MTKVSDRINSSFASILEEQNLRDEFAKSAMTAIAKKYSYRSMTFDETLFYQMQIAHRAYQIADAMMVARKLPKEKLEPTSKECIIDKAAFKKAEKKYNAFNPNAFGREFELVLEEYLKNCKK